MIVFQVYIFLLFQFLIGIYQMVFNWFLIDIY